MLRKIILLLFITSVIFAQNKNWKLPLELSEQNSKFIFEVDSTWVLVKGTTRNFTGKIWLETPNDFKTLKAELKLPVAQFDTGLDMRDDHMYEVMASDKFPEVIVRIDSINGSCTIEEIEKNKKCNFEQIGTLEIRGVKRELKLNSNVTKENNNYILSGNVSFNWKDFGVEDPSNLVAKLYDTVKVTYQVDLGN